jgi:hypothetical protein
MKSKMLIDAGIRYFGPKTNADNDPLSFKNRYTTLSWGPRQIEDRRILTIPPAQVIFLPVEEADLEDLPNSLFDLGVRRCCWIL